LINVDDKKTTLAKPHACVKALSSKM